MQNAIRQCLKMGKFYLIKFKDCKITLLFCNYYALCDKIKLKICKINLNNFIFCSYYVVRDTIRLKVCKINLNHLIFCNYYAIHDTVKPEVCKMYLNNCIFYVICYYYAIGNAIQ